MPRVWYVRLEASVRLAIGIAGLSLVVFRRRVGDLADRWSARAIPVALAAALAFAASEAVLRLARPHPTEWLSSAEEPQRVGDAELGWVLAPARTGRSRVGGRDVEYAIDAAGYRVARADRAVDPTQPTVVFAGESVMFGEGLMWSETVPAQVSAMVGIQSANIAVHGYSTDQIYLRLARELPRFRQPLAVVALFMTTLFGRNLDDDRPHLGPELEWLPAQAAPRLLSLASLLVPYRRDATVERGIATTRAVLRAIVGLAHERHAAALIVVPQLGVEDSAERRLRERIVDDASPHVVVGVDGDWRLPWDRHPNARAAEAIATAVARELNRAIGGRNLAADP